MSSKPVVFISYSHKDEPPNPVGEEVAWLSRLRSYLQPAVKFGVIELFIDQHLRGGDELAELERKVCSCDVFILLVSPHSMASAYIVDTELRLVRDRRNRGEDVRFYPLLLKPTPKERLEKLEGLLIRPWDATPLSSFTAEQQRDQLRLIVEELSQIATEIAERKQGQAQVRRFPDYVHTSGLPQLSYETLVGRTAELAFVDRAWRDGHLNIVSLIGDAGSGKSAILNEWLIKLQIGGYRGAEIVLGWSFYSQGTKERATSADAFLDWAVEKLKCEPQGNSATAKAEAVAESLVVRRVLLILDGVEPLQHGTTLEHGLLKDHGLRVLLRRCAASNPRGLIVLTSRIAVRDIELWRETSCPVLEVEHLSDDYGAALLRDNGVWGAVAELRSATHEFGGHPMALSLLASFVTETQEGDIRRRDHIRSLLRDSETPGHDHTRRVMESFESEWLRAQPLLFEIMMLVGLFDRPARGTHLEALRSWPAILGVTEHITSATENAWRHALARLRDVRLLSPIDANEPEAIDAHPLIREWFGERLQHLNQKGSNVAHARLYEYLRDSTLETDSPTLEDLAPLYQAIAHGCRAGLCRQALNEIYAERICRRKGANDFQYYASKKLGALGTELSAISWFFQLSYTIPRQELEQTERSWVLTVAAFSLRSQGRFSESLTADRAALMMSEGEGNWHHAAIRATNISEVELLTGNIGEAIRFAEKSIKYGDIAGGAFHKMARRKTLADALHASGQRSRAEALFKEAELYQADRDPTFPILISIAGYNYANLLIATGRFAEAAERAEKTIYNARKNNWLLDIALDTLTLGRAQLGLALYAAAGLRPEIRMPLDIDVVRRQFDDAVNRLHSASQMQFAPPGFISRAAFRRSVGDWHGAARDLDEAEEIARSGPMRLFLCDISIERVRLYLAQRESYAPLLFFGNSATESLSISLSEPSLRLEEIIRATVEFAQSSGYLMRNAELVELNAVLQGHCTFASLPARV